MDKSEEKKEIQGEREKMCSGHSGNVSTTPAGVAQRSYIHQKQSFMTKDANHRY